MRVIFDNTPMVKAEATAAIVRALEIIGLKAEKYAKALCPVDTSNLRNSINHTVKEKTTYVGTNVEYAPYVELGTSRMGEKPYLRPSIQDHLDEYKNIIETELKK